MPVLPYRFHCRRQSIANVSLRAIFEQNNDVEFLKEIVPQLVKYIAETKWSNDRYFEWFKNERVINESGLVTIIHPWESGLDLSPAYDPALGVPERIALPIEEFLIEEARARPTWGQAYFPLIKLIFEYHFIKGNSFQIFPNSSQL